MESLKFIVDDSKTGSEHLLVNPSIVNAITKNTINYNNPVLAGDFPDPSIVRVGDDYWATATSSEWAPYFPIFHSRDLINWKLVSYVFDKAPEWSISNYWAPEISYYQGKFYVYYSARKKGGVISVAVAIADKAEGPYIDYGPLVSQDSGSIDAIAALDENGERYLIWKEDGNSRNLPTPLWAQRLSENGTELIGDRHEIMCNDEIWEDELIEGHSIIQKDGWFYMFYSGSSCCGHECKYATGVARSRKLLGPWQKHSANPILKGNEFWKCPGHGTVVENGQGKYFFLYHAYSRKDSIYVGRQGMLDEITWDSNDWPIVNNNNGPTHKNYSNSVDKNLRFFSDNFNSPQLKPEWQWPVSNKPLVKLFPENGGSLELSPSGLNYSDPLAAVLAKSTTTSNYTATTSVDTFRTKKNTYAGICLFGNTENAIGISIINKKIIVWQKHINDYFIIATDQAPKDRFISLRLKVRDGHLVTFFYSTDYYVWQSIGEEINGKYLPPWDRGLKIALNCGGSKTASAVFKEINIDNQLLGTNFLEVVVI